MEKSTKFKKVGESTILDTVSNELYAKENVNYRVSEARPPKIRKEFMLLFQEALHELAKDRTLHRSCYTVLIYLLGMMDFENCVYISQRELAEDLDTTQQQISKAIALLIGSGYIKAFIIRGNVNIYMISPALCLRGDIDTRRKIVRTWNRLGGNHG
jgi:hypothetical protein